MHEKHQNKQTNKIEKREGRREKGERDKGRKGGEKKKNRDKDNLAVLCVLTAVELYAFLKVMLFAFKNIS